MKKIRTSNMLLVIVILFQLAFVKIVNIANIRMTVPMALLFSQLTILLPFLIWCILAKKNLFQEIRFKKTKPISIFFAFLIAIFSYPVVIFLNLVSMLFVENAVAEVMPSVLSMGLIPSLFFMAVLPAFVEETIFRGMLYNTYSKYRPVAGVILSAVLFGLMHMNFNQMPYAIYLGIIMAIMMEVCDSIIVPMVVHFTMNASSTILSFLSSELLQASGEAAASSDLKSAFMESYTMTIEQMGIEFSQAQMDAMFPMFMAAMIVGFGIVAIGALAVVVILMNAVANINNRPLKQVFKKKTEEKLRFMDIWLILFVIYTLYECVVSLFT